MGFKANIDIALSFSTLKICSVRQQGRLKFRICLYYTTNNEQGQRIVEQIQYCHPYSILRKQSEPKSFNQPYKNYETARSFNGDKHKVQFHPNFMFPIEESQLDLSSDYYISKPFKMLFQRQNHSIMETCCFRTYIDIQKYADVDLKCQVELMFCPNAVTQDSAAFKTIGRCECKIRKLFDISTYLPIVFDQFEGVVIEGIYQAALIDFRYEKDQTETKKSLNPQNFHQYLKQITNGFTRSQTRNFYRYYRDLLEKELFTIQQRHYDLVRVLGINTYQQQFRILRVNANSKLEAMIDHLGGYNSHQSIYSMPSQRSIQKSSVQSLSTNTDEVAYLNRGIIIRGQQNHRSPFTLDKYKQELSEEIIYDFLTIKAHIFKKWSEYLQFTTKNISMIAQKYKVSYNASVKQRLSGNVFSHRVNSVDWKKCAYDDSGQQHLRLAETDRKKIQKDEQLWKEAFLVQNQGFFVKDAKNIKIFQEIFEVAPKIGVNSKSQKSLLRKSLQRHNNFINPYSLHSKVKRNYYNESQSSFQLGRKNSLPMNLNGFRIQQQLQGIQLMISSVANQNEEQDHFIVLVHGFQASRQDFIVLKNCLQIRFKTKVFISTCNEGRTDDDIETQGKRLALELQRYLNESSPSFNYKLSFIGHSMGGIIIRTALCYLQNVDQHLYSFITFSAPHLGYLYAPSTHIQAGLWFMNTWHKAHSIEQICVTDKEDLRQSFLYRLSKSKSIDKFKHIALVGSSQDKYVPYESARIEQNQKIIQYSLSTDVGRVVNQMIDNILGTIECKQLSRMDVIFSIEQSNFDSMIGRTAHIKYLSDRQFIKVFCIVFDKFFK